MADGPDTAAAKTAACLSRHVSKFLYPVVRTPSSLRVCRGPRCARGVAALAGLVVVAALGLCVTSAQASDHGDAATYFVSIGDSYATGYRPGPADHGEVSRDAFVYQVEHDLRRDDRHLELVNFGCTGQTAYAMAFDRGCDPAARAPGGPAYPYTPQAIAAADFIAAHHDRIRLVTVAAGINDVAGCLQQAPPASAQACAEAQVSKVKLTLDALLVRVRAAIGDAVPVVGVSYINVFLADVIKRGQPPQRASFSTSVFRNYLNPVLQQMYSKYHAYFVDTTALAGGYLPQTDQTFLPGFGTVTASIGRVCALTYYCNADDPHPNRFGHALIAAEIERLTST